MTREQEAIEEFDEAYKQAWQFWSPFLREARKNHRFVMGDQWTAKEKKKILAQDREPLVFNKAKRVVRLIEGYQRKHRLALKAEPIEGSDDKTASQLTGCLMWALQYCNAYNVLSDAFSGGSLKTGFNLVHTYMDYSEDPVNGDIRYKRIPYNKFMVDPYFTERDFSDCGYLLRREYFARDTCQFLIPDQANEIKRLAALGQDDKFPYFKPPVDLMGGKFLRYDEMWVRKYTPEKTLLDTRTGAWARLNEKNNNAALLRKIPGLKVIDGYKKTVELRIFIEGQMLHRGPDPGGLDNYPYVPIMGFWEPEHHEAKWKLQPLIYCVRDPNTEINKRRLKMLDIIDTAIYSGWKAESDAVVDPKALYQTGQGRVVFMKPGKLAKAEELKGTDIPAGLFKLAEMLDKDVVEIPGANAEMFGAPESQDIRQAGILSKLRQSAGLTDLQDLFDNYRLAKRLIGRNTIKLIQHNFTPEKIRMIINEEPTEEFYNKKFGKYDCMPQEGVLSDSQRQMYYAELRAMKAEGAPIPWAAIMDAAPLQWKSKLQQHMQAQEAQMAKDMEFQKLMEKMTAALMQAKEMKDIETARQKISQQQEDRAGAALDRIKAAKEMGQMDVDNIFEILRFILELEQMQNQPQEKSGKPLTKR